MSNDAPPDVHIQHDTPPIFYCWKYWLANGKFSEGCTPVKTSPSNFLDLNDFGWVYIVIPVIGLFLLVLIFYCFCRGKSQEVAKRQPLISEESESEIEEEVFHPRNKSSGPYRSVPVRNADPRNFYTMVQIDPENSVKMPLQGDPSPLHASYPPKQRMYPRLTELRRQQSSNGRQKSTTKSHQKSVDAEVRPKSPPQEPPVEDHLDSTSESEA